MSGGAARDAPLEREARDAITDARHVSALDQRFQQSAVSGIPSERFRLGKKAEASLATGKLER